MKRWICAAGCGLVMWCAWGTRDRSETPAWAQAPSETPASAAAARRPPARSAVPENPLEARLRTELDCEFIDLPLRDMLAYFKASLDVNLIVDSVAWDGDTADLDQVVNFQAKQIPARTALRTLLVPHGLIYTLRPGAVVITPQDKARKELSLKMYDVADLLRPTSARGDLTPDQIRQEVDDLLSLILHQTGDDKLAPWAAIQGEGAPEPTLLSFPEGLLVVRQTTLGHEDIADLLETLRAAQTPERVQRMTEDPPAISTVGSLVPVPQPARVPTYRLPRRSEDSGFQDESEAPTEQGQSAPRPRRTYE